MAKRSSRSAREEWSVGIRPLPSLVENENERFRPEVLVWMGPAGEVLGQRVARPGEALGLVVESYEETAQRPLVGSPRRPTEIRTDSAEIAAVLRGAGLDVYEDDTPELDELFDAWAGKEAAAIAGEVASYTSCGASTEKIAGFFSAAAALVRLDPWSYLDDGDEIAVAIESPNARERIAVWFGEQELSDLVVFDDAERFEAMRSQSSDDVVAGDRPSGYTVVRWLNSSSVSTGLRKEAMSHGWEVASADAFPVLLRDGAPVVRAEDFDVLEAVMRALTAVFTAEPADAIDAAFVEPGRTIERTVPVAIARGDVSVRVRIPRVPIAPYEWVREWIDAEARGDLDAIWQINVRVVEAFANSTDGMNAPDQGGAVFIMERLAAPDEPRSMVSLEPEELVAFVVEGIPAVFDGVASDAPAVVEGLRAFIRYLAHEVALPGADGLLAALGDDTERKFANALAQRAKRVRTAGVKRAKPAKGGKKARKR